MVLGTGSECLKECSEECFSSLFLPQNAKKHSSEHALGHSEPGAQNDAMIMFQGFAPQGWFSKALNAAMRFCNGVLVETDFEASQTLLLNAFRSLKNCLD